MKKFLLAVALLSMVAACSSKKKVGDGLDSAEAISSLPLEYGQGSDGGKIPGLTSVNFAYDQYTLSDKAKEILAQNIQWMNTNANISMQIEGHCDSRGSIEYNLTLGERRANAVKSYMVGQGIAEGRLSVISYGEEKPLDGSDTDSAHGTNRRANFVPIQ